MHRNGRSLALSITVGAALLLAGCEYARLLRPSVLKQLNPDVARLVNELPAVDRPNEEIVARLFAHGGLGHATLGTDGVHRISVQVPEGEYLWKPAIVVMQAGGELELEFANADSFSHHAAYVQGNGGRMQVMLPVHERGRVRVQLDGPGLYWFGCPVGNHVLRGMLGMIIVGGEVPPEAKLDRPPQSREIVVPIRSHPENQSGATLHHHQRE